MAVGISMTRAHAVALMLATGTLALVAAPAPVLAQAVPHYAETPSDALARNVRLLADHPRDFNALVAAGKAALQLGDAQAAAGFFGRAEEVNANNPMPQTGMGAALVMTGDPAAALTYFARAQQLGATRASIGCDRGLAYDLLGNPSAAQADYRAALSGVDRDEARRRLALSLAISGNKAEALSTLDPLLKRRDHGAVRVRALVLALNGEVNTAKTVIDYTMPGAGARMMPFFARLSTLTSVQKAAAVHLGIFPDSGTALASAPPAAGGDRLASIDDLLRDQPEAAPAAAPPPVRYSYAAPAPSGAVQRPPVQLASVPRRQVEQARSPKNDLIQTERVASSANSKKIWLQLASGDNAAELPGQFTKIRSRKPSLFEGISGHVAQSGSKARLVIGPFHSEEDARLFADALSSVRIDSFRWVSQPGQVVRKLSTQ
jgi:Flp pilus assembly protein TadD